MYLIDTNVICELIKRSPDKNVLNWFSKVSDSDLFISVVTVGEIRKGLARIKDEKYKEKVRMWIDQEIPKWFSNRILPINIEVANKWGMLQATANRTLPAIDSLIAATALHSDLKIVTRNVKDYEFEFIEIVNPY